MNVSSFIHNSLLPPEFFDGEVMEVSASGHEWAVQPWLADELQARGEATARIGGHEFWGRACSGQAIYNDGVIQAIPPECFANAEESYKRND